MSYPARRAASQSIDLRMRAGCHHVDLARPGRCPQQRDCQVSAEMFAEVAQAAKDGKAILVIGRQQSVIPGRKAEPFEKRDGALAVRVRQQSRENGVAGVERDADRHRLAVAQRVMGEDFEAMRRPVAEIERARACRSRTDLRPARSGACADAPNARSTVARAAPSRFASAALSCSSHWKKAASRISATFTASEMPARLSRRRAGGR